MLQLKKKKTVSVVNVPELVHHDTETTGFSKAIRPKLS